jgi:hypothetical protein
MTKFRLVSGRVFQIIGFGLFIANILMQYVIYNDDSLTKKGITNVNIINIKGKEFFISDDLYYAYYSSIIFFFVSLIVSFLILRRGRVCF